jgi:hypothetical protein
MLESMFPKEEWVRVIAHPERKIGMDEGHESVGDIVVRMTDLEFPMERDGRRRQILIAIG